MEYKRLTKRNCAGYVVPVKPIMSGYSNIQAAEEELLDRLAELEDKIENGTLVPKYSIVDCGDTHCVCAVDTNNLLVIGEYETKAEAEKRLEEIRRGYRK